MKTRHLISTGLFAFLSIFAAQGAPVTDWHTFRAGTATTLSGQGTSSPTIGNSTEIANTAVVVGYFDGIALTNLGDRITFSYQISFTDAATFGSGAGDQLRFALFDLNGQSRVVAENSATAGVDGQTDDWRGYWFGHRGGTGTGSAGSIRERSLTLSGSDNPFTATSPNSAASLGPVGGTPVTLLSSTSPSGGAVYSAQMSLERTPSGVALAGFLSGNGGTNIFLANDNASPFPQTYGAVGYLFGNALNVDQVNLQNVDVSYAASNALQITSHPSSVTVNPGQPAQFSVSWTGSGIIPSIQWRENGFDISGATNSTYTIASAAFGQNQNTYSVVIQNVFGDSVTSSNATLGVIADSVLPTVSSASSLVANTINVIFSEQVDAGTAQNGSNYSLPGHTIAEITIVAPNNVALLLDNPLTSSNYVLNVQGVQDLSGNPMVATNVPGKAHGFDGAIQINIANGLAYAIYEKIKIHAGGADIFNSSDECEYAYKSYSGDFDVAVKVESLLNTDANAKAGLMARVKGENHPFVYPDSRNVMIAATPGRFLFQFRSNPTLATTSVSTPRPPTSYPNSWIRLKRTGSVITGYSSTNLSEWTLISSHDTSEGVNGAYPNDIWLGLAVTSHNVNSVTEAVFSDFGTLAPQAPVLAISRTGNDVNLQWPSSGFTLQRTASLTPPVAWSNVDGSEAGTQATIAIEGGPVFFRLTK